MFGFLDVLTQVCVLVSGLVASQLLENDFTHFSSLYSTLLLLYMVLFIVIRNHMPETLTKLQAEGALVRMMSGEVSGTTSINVNQKVSVEGREGGAVEVAAGGDQQHTEHRPLRNGGAEMRGVTDYGSGDGGAAVASVSSVSSAGDQEQQHGVETDALTGGRRAGVGPDNPIVKHGVFGSAGMYTGAAFSRLFGNECASPRRAGGKAGTSIMQQVVEDLSGNEGTNAGHDSGPLVGGDGSVAEGSPPAKQVRAKKPAFRNTPWTESDIPFPEHMERPTSKTLALYTLIFDLFAVVHAFAFTFLDTLRMYWNLFRSVNPFIRLWSVQCLFFTLR